MIKQNKGDRDKDAMQIRRGYRGGNEVKHNIFDSRLSNTVLGKEEKKKLINVVLSKIATNIK